MKFNLEEGKESEIKIKGEDIQIDKIKDNGTPLYACFANFSHSLDLPYDDVSKKKRRYVKTEKIDEFDLSASRDPASS